MELGRRLHGQVRNEVSLVFLPIVQPPSGGIIEETNKDMKREEDREWMWVERKKKLYERNEKINVRRNIIDRKGESERKSWNCGGLVIASDIAMA